MVRTYAFNPSTQISESLPGAKEREPYQHPVHAEPNQQLSDTSPSPLPYLPFPFELQNHPLDASFSTTSSSYVPSSIVEGAWKIFGIRTVIIDGQAYYQPIDPEIQRLIDQQIETMGIINQPSKSTSPPQDPGPTSDSNPLANSQAMLAALHLAATQSMLPSKAINTASMTNSNGSQNPHEKHFSAYDPAIRKNIVGLPVIHPGKIALATMNHVHNAQNGIYEAKNNGNPHEMIEDLPPWARGNPQPRSGKRGTVDWNQGQRTLPLNGAPILPSASSLYFNKPPMPYTESQHGSQSLLNSFGSTLARALPFPRQNHPPPAELYQSFASSYSPHSGLSPPLVHYPLQASNSYGNFYTGPSTSNAFITPAFNYVNPYPPGHAKHEKEQHKLELLQQIEDNRRRKEAEKQSEWEMEERERIRSEVFAARQRAEIEEEQRKQRNQAIAAERKAARIAESNPDLKNKARRPSDSRHNQGRRGSITSQHSTNGGLEWWEKKKTFDIDDNRGRSPMIPALNQRRNSVQEVSAAAATASASLVRRTPSPVAHRQRSASQVHPQSPMRPSEKAIGSAKQDRSLSRLSRRSYQPSIASRNASRLDDSLRLSATHRQLDDEHNRVKQTLENNNYDKHFYD